MSRDRCVILGICLLGLTFICIVINEAIDGFSWTLIAFSVLFGIPANAFLTAGIKKSLDR